MSSLQGPRDLLRRLRQVMADSGGEQERLDQIVALIAHGLMRAVCSIYLRRADDYFELSASIGLNPDAVHHTALRLGEGLVGDIARHARPLNLADAQSHPRFVHHAETGERAFKSFVGVPILRGGAVVGVLVVQDISPRHFVDEEVEALQTVAMVLAEIVAVDAARETEPEPARSFVGHGLTEGLALGHVVLHAPRIEVTRLIADDVAEENGRLERAMYDLRRNVDTLLRTEDVSHAGEHLDVLQSYRMFANDDGWFRRIRGAIATGLTAEAAVERVMNDMRARFVGGRDAYLRDRLHDFEDLSNRLLRALNARALSAADDKLPRDAILVARMMGPAELLDYDRRKLRALVLEEGALEAHVAIVARALNLPLVGDVRGIIGACNDGDAIIVDAEDGGVYVRPDKQLTAAYVERTRAYSKRQRRYARVRKLPAITRDGVRISVGMNAGLAVDVDNIDETGADVIGLFRTELQFMVSARFPRVTEQARFYRSVIARAAPRQIVFRTLDIGSDKMLPYMRTTPEDNPAMGWRALRIALDRPGLLCYQLRALMQAVRGGEMSVMFPMVTTVAEFDRAKYWLEREKSRAHRFGRKVPRAIRVGAMLEVPALVWELDSLMPKIDFLSVGTNDLLQFFFASDRGNTKLGGRYDALTPSALRMFREIARAGARHNVPVSLCGEIAGRPLEAMSLLGLGFRRFSVPRAAIGTVKRVIRSANLPRLEARVHALLDTPPPDMRAALADIAELEGIKL